jgi:hypothetical protein
MYLDIAPCLDYINADLMAHGINFSNNFDIGLQKGEETSQLVLLKASCLDSLSFVGADEYTRFMHWGLKVKVILEVTLDLVHPD